jgi:hypothetical protein
MSKLVEYYRIYEGKHKNPSGVMYYQPTFNRFWKKNLVIFSLFHQEIFSVCHVRHHRTFFVQRL